MTRSIKNQVTGQSRLNTLGLGPKRLDEVLDVLDRASATAGTNSKRVDARWPFRQPCIAVNLQHPGGSEVETRMACRNLSRSGVSLLHSAFVYPGTSCVVRLPHPDGIIVPVRGRIVRCEHRSGVVHEIGVNFENTIDLRGFVRPDPIRQMFSVENVDASALAGRLLYVEPNPLDAQLIRHFIRESGVRLRVATTIADATEAARAGVDLILCEFHLPETTGGEWIARLRTENIPTPAILVSADQGQRVLQYADGRRAQAFLAKPIAPESLLRALAEFLADTREAGPASPARLDNGLLQSMKPELVRCAAAIGAAVEKNLPMDALSVCLQLRAVAPSLGLSDMTRDLDEAVGGLSADLNIEPIAEVLGRVIAACKAAA